jgi:hypothetical protein
MLIRISLNKAILNSPNVTQWELRVSNAGVLEIVDLTPT